MKRAYGREHRIAGAEPAPQRSGPSSASARRSRLAALYRRGVEGDLEIIRQAFRHDRDIARTLGLDPAQLSRWSRGQAPSRESWVAVRALATAVSELLERYDPAVIPGWFHSPAVQDGKTPAELLRQGRRAELLAYVEAAVEGSYS